MTSVGQKLLRFAGALLLGGAATAIDYRTLSAPPATAPVPVASREAPIVAQAGPARAQPTGPGLEMKISPGKRAMAIRIDDVAGISGLMQPNSRVDVLVVIDGEKGRVAKIFMENMRVLAFGAITSRSTDGRIENIPVATLEVTPEEGERLAMATRQGQIHLLLRGNGDPNKKTPPLR